MQLTADITITITWGIIHIQIERWAITAIIPFTAKLSNYKANSISDLWKQGAFQLPIIQSILNLFFLSLKPP